MFYDLDSSRVTLREYAWGTPKLLLPLMAVLKLLRVRIPSSTDDPDVDRLELFRIDPEDLPADLRAKFRRIEEQLGDCGFMDPVCHLIEDPATATRICLATFRHQSMSRYPRRHRG